MYKIKGRIFYCVLCVVLCVLMLSLCSCGEKNKSDVYAEIYGTTIAGLEDDELFAIVETGASSPVLLVTSQVYDDGFGNQAALLCDVYYVIDGEVKNIGVLESFGTAYPVSYDKSGLYTASGHALHRFEIDEDSETLILAESIYEQFDEDGNASYSFIKGEKTEAITEEEYYKAFEKYGEAVVVDFSYGASGS